MFRLGVLLLFFALFSSCHKKREVDASFYYWKTSYEASSIEDTWLDTLHSTRMYVRIMDIDISENGSAPVPISPVIFKDKIPARRELVPVVFIVNNVLKNRSHQQLSDLATKILFFVKGKVSQAGKNKIAELQIDCDWTKSTRENYFFLLTELKHKLSKQQTNLSATLRLHQLKNLIASGIPPVDRVMLMCYNMGNLRQYGDQNSILEQAELEKYIGKNIGNYPLPVDVGLPLFSWAVAFRKQAYIGIPKKITEVVLHDTALFKEIKPNRFLAKKDLPEYGLTINDELRWESVPIKQLQAAAVYIAQYLNTNKINMIYFHLDEQLLKKFSYEDLEKTTAIFR
ncbi:hypothetical protein [Pedobacter duraquae]|uniref:Lipoprotein n=1 Tax=Pedobacter duraquae TaxID=425511 RepID=A0A4R6IDU2_9SPHI|nr:hypothetical protein [Pedobacter duraquae]TDO20192.1 hypothetical protein CLV32_3952 [Pedobacter duraquae]